MSIEENPLAKDVIKVGRAGLRNLYLQLADYYTESIKTGAEINPNLISYLEEDTPGIPIFKFLKTETSIEDFVDRMMQLSGDSAKSFESMTEYLIKQYDFFGIAPPPEGFLQVYYDVKAWWKFRTRFQNGYFIFTEVFNYNEKNISKSGLTFNGGSPYFFDPMSKDTIIAGELERYLIEETKKQYLTYASQNNFETIVSEDQIEKEYFFFLDEGKNSINFVSDPNGASGKVYIRTFFNEFGQKLNASLTQIEGVGKLKKLPGGIRKNYIIRNLKSGIDAHITYLQKDGPPEPRKLEIINGLKEVKKLLEKSIKGGEISNGSRIGFIFTEDYEFLSAVDSENQLINNFELYRFLKDKTRLNATIVRLNAENCRLVGSPEAPSLKVNPFGSPPNAYEHFVIGGQSYKEETPMEKAVNYRVKRSTLKYIGDTGLRLIFEELKKHVPSEILEIYRTILNRLDIAELAKIFASLKSLGIKLPDLRKLYFRVFIESLDITELIDCVVENAGRPQEQRTIISSPAFDVDGNPTKDIEKTITSQSSLDFELELKTILYSKFSFFYNIAKEADSDLFDFPTSEDALPNVKDLVDAREEAGQKLLDDGPGGGIQIKSQIEQKKKLLEQLNKPNSVNKNLIPEVTEDLITKETELAALEQALIDAQAALQDVVEKNFMYVLMIPESQMSSIYNTIVSNDPQYKYKPELINAGMLEARNTPGFSPSLFIETLFKNEVFKFVFGLEGDLFVDFYDNIAQSNKKLKTNEEIKKDFEKLNDQAQDLGGMAKTSKRGLPKVPTFDIYKIRYPTFSLDAVFSELIKRAYDEAMKAALKPMANASKTAMDSSFNGDEDSFNRLDPNLKAEYTSNDLVETALAGALSGFASPLEIYLKAKVDVFPLNTVAQIEKLFDELHKKIEIQLQVKLMANTLDEEDTDIARVKDIFADCELNNTFSKITDFFVWLRDLLSGVGGLDLLFKRIEEARLASLRNTDVCDDNFEFLDDLLAANDSAAAIKALEEVLGSLNDKKRNALMPDMFGCSDNTGKDSVFPDFYSEPIADSMNKHVKGMIDGVNNFFNNDIGKFKSIILEQNKNGNQILDELFGTTLNKRQKTVQDFERNKNKMVNGETIPIETRNEYKSKQRDLRKILIKILNASPPELFQVNTGVEGLIVYKFNFFDSYIYEIVINQNDNEEVYRGETLEPNSGYIFFSKIEGDDSVEIILFQKVFAAIDGIADPIQMYATLISLYNPLSFANSVTGALYKNKILQVDYPSITDASAPTGQKPFQYYSQKLLNFLYAKDAAEDDANFSKANKRLLEVLLDSLTTSFVNGASIFDNENFNNIPLQDLENPDYVDNGILMTDEVFKKYQDLRKEYQCFLTFDGSQDAHLLSNLKALYKLLFNCLIIESLMAQFFTLGQEQLSFANSSTVKDAVLLGIDESFANSVTKIGDLQTDYTSDINLLYKFEVLEKKRAAGSNLEEPLDANGNPEWQYETRDEKINYLASEYYDKIINRLQNRIETAVPDFQLSAAGALSNLSNVFIKKPNGDALFDMYDTVDYSDDEKVVPVLNGLRKGLILQKFVDVRQNGSIMTDFKNGNLPGSTPSKYVISGGGAIAAATAITAKISLAIDLNNNYLPYLRGDAFEVDTTDTVMDAADLVGNLKFPGYPNAFFTGKSSTGDGYDSPTFASAAPKLSTFVIGDIDTEAQYTPATPSYERKWYNKFYETQGKISDFSYAFSYGGDSGQSAIDIFDQTLAPYLIKNGPSAYYKKASAGVRLCMALRLDMNSAKLGTDWNNILDNHGPQGNPIAKEIYKEKFGLYKNELGEQFILIPLIERDKDYLKIAQDEWEESDSINWWKNLYTNINSHDFTDNKNLVTQLFTDTYPYTTNLGQAIPITVQTLINLQYDNKLSNMFDLTKDEILRLIKMVKGVANGEWDMNVENMTVPGMDMYGALALSLIPILIKLLATFVDPTWNTPWFLPGPLGPIGYTAKILDTIGK